jgi:hypothetical protein
MRENRALNRIATSGDAISAFAASLDIIAKIRINTVSNWDFFPFMLFDMSDNPRGAVSILTPISIYLNLANIATGAPAHGESYAQFLPAVVVHELTHVGLNFQSLLGLALPNRGVRYWLLDSDKLAEEVQAAFSIFLGDRKVTPCSPFGN